MGWSNTGAVAIFTTQVNLVDANGNVVGLLNGINGLELFGNLGTKNNPNFQVTPAGDLIFGALSAATGLTVTGTQGIQAGGVLVDHANKDRLFIYLNSASLTSSPEVDAFVVPVSGSADGTEGAVVMCVPFAVPQDPASAGDIPFGIPETWKAVAFSNGWSNTGGTGPVECRLDSSGFVHLDGRCSPGTAADGTVIFTVPAGYAPPQDQVFVIGITAAADPSSPTRIVVNVDGTVQIFGAGSLLSASMAGITWRSTLLTP